MNNYCYSAYNEDSPFVSYEVSRAEPHKPQNNVYCQDGQKQNLQHTVYLGEGWRWMGEGWMRDGGG